MKEEEIKDKPAEEKPGEEAKKAPVKVDFVPDPEFSWGLSLEEFGPKKGKKKKDNGEEIGVVIIK